VTYTPFKKITFTLITLLLPFIILLLIEGILVVANFGHSYPLFIDKVTKNEPVKYLQPNPDVIQRYFSEPRFAPNVSPDTVYFSKQKPKQSFRIVIQGGSTAAGFPYGRWASLQGMLEQRFKRLYPDKNIEIINTAMAAVNSYTLLDFVDEIIAQQPDLVLIYAGHNEYLGIMGVGSAIGGKGGRLATVLHLAFKDWRLYQLMQRGYNKIILGEQPLQRTDKSLMSQVAKEKDIALDSELFELGIKQFSNNMSSLLSKYQAAGVPVVLGNLVSNESGQVPFSSVGHVNWKNIRANVATAKVSPPLFSLTPDLTSKDIAANYFEYGLYMQAQGRYSEAKLAFVLAKEHDLLRFRAPSQFNEIIANLAKQYQTGLVDVQALFAEYSEGGIIGNKLMLEHLHPTIEGYFLLAEAYSDYIFEQQFLGTASKFTVEQARADIPLTQLDALYGEFTIRKLMNDYPFTEANTQANKTIDLPKSRDFEKQALIRRIESKDWLSVQKDLLIAYQERKEPLEAAKIAAALSTAMIDNHQASYIAGQLYQGLKDWQLAAYYHKKALQVNTNDTTYQLALAKDYFFLKQYSKSLALLQKADALVDETSPQKKAIKNYIRQVNTQIVTN
jgi:lysophospholipase L1-like esterase